MNGLLAASQWTNTAGVVWNVTPFGGKAQNFGPLARTIHPDREKSMSRARARRMRARPSVMTDTIDAVALGERKVSV